MAPPVSNKMNQTRGIKFYVKTPLREKRLGIIREKFIEHRKYDESFILRHDLQDVYIETYSGQTAVQYEYKSAS